MKLFLKRIALLTCCTIGSVLLMTCEKLANSNAITDPIKVIFRMEKVDKNNGFTNANADPAYSVHYSVTSAGDSLFYLALDTLADRESKLYLRSKYVEWGISSEINKLAPLPNGVSITFSPQVTNGESYTIMKVTVDETSIPSNGTYRCYVKGKIPKSQENWYFELYITVNFPLSKLTPHFQFNSLVIAPGETKTNRVIFDDIKPGQSYRIDHKTNNSDFLKDSWVSTTESIFTTDKNSATWSVAVPASANPNIDDEGVNLYPTFLNTNKLIEFDGNQNGFLVYIAGYTVQSMEVKGGNSVTFGDTAKISVNYIVNGNGTFTPKITPPGVITADMLDIIMPAIEQDITTQYGKRLVKVTYHVFFKKMPTNKNVTFAVGGDITYGKAVPKQLTITLK